MLAWADSLGGWKDQVSLATKECDSVLIEDKYDVFYLLVMTSNVSSFVCLAEVAVILYVSPFCVYVFLFPVVLQRALHSRRYSSLPRVSLRGASFQLHSFPVWHDFDGGRAPIFAKIVRQPHLIAPDTPAHKACSSSE